MADNGLATTASTAREGKAPDRVGIIPIGKIRQNEVALRGVAKDEEGYLNLVDSVKKRGILVPIVVREFENPQKPGEMLYGLIDGLQRYNASLDAGLKEIPAKITDMEQAEVEESQIVANAQRIETKPAEYADAIDRLLQRNPTMTVIELAGKLSKSTGWIYKMLGMAKKLHEDLKPLVNEHRIGLANAIEIAKLPEEEQIEWSEKAQTMEPGEFAANVAQRMKTIKEARRKGQKEGPTAFQPVPHGRKWAEVKAEFLTKALRDQLITRHNAKTAQDGWDLAIAWASNMDPDSQVQQQQEHEAEQARKAAESEAKKLEKTRQREEEARKTREELEAKIQSQSPATAAS